MCAIAGVFRIGGVNTTPVSAMARSLAHRGPDQHTVRRYGGKSAYAAMGVERLAIVDIDHGQQPAADPSGRYRVAMNGEVYNHDTLRRELLANGVALQSRSDTEVVAALIATNGLERALAMCHGMFAMAVLDTMEQRLYLVRDRMGVKPIHWTQCPDGTVVFASEIKGLRAHPDLQWKLDAIAVQSYLMFEYVPSPMTIWEGVHKVEPGCWIEMDASGVREKRWWSAPAPIGGRPGNFDRWAQSLFGSLQVAVKQRLSADVDIGFLLSGGLDSASVAAIAASIKKAPIKTFSLSISADGFDERDQAAETAHFIGSDHVSTLLGPNDLEPLLMRMTRVMDEPLADSSLIATWRLMEAVKDAGLKCVISGDGADETFGGYPTYFAHQLSSPAAWFRGGLQRALNKLPVRTNGVTADYMARRFVEGLGLPWQRRHQIWMGSWLPEEIGIHEAVWERVDALSSQAGEDDIGRAMFLDQRLYLSDGVLVKVDRAAGAYGIEVRSPFLDHSIVELGASMGTGHHIRGTANKRVLRSAMASILPEGVCHRPKKGFGTPVGPWLRGSSRHLLDNLPERTAAWIPEDDCAQAIAQHIAGEVDHRRRLWSALVLAQWAEGPHGLT